MIRKGKLKIWLWNEKMRHSVIDRSLNTLKFSDISLTPHVAWPAVVKVVFMRWWNCAGHGNCGVRAYSGGLGAEPPVGSRAKPPEAGGILMW